MALIDDLPRARTYLRIRSRRAQINAETASARLFPDTPRYKSRVALGLFQTSGVRAAAAAARLGALFRCGRGSEEALAAARAVNDARAGSPCLCARLYCQGCIARVFFFHSGRTPACVVYIRGSGVYVLGRVRIELFAFVLWD